MVEKLPLVVWPKTLAQDKTRIKGYLSVEKLPRLLYLCLSPQAPIEATLRFELNPVYDCVSLTMEINTTLVLECQRCLSRMPWETRLQSQLSIVNNNIQASRLPRSTDYYVCTSDKISTTELIEDELLLVVPQNPVHDSSDECNPEFINYLNRYRRQSKMNDNPFKELKN